MDAFTFLEKAGKSKRQPVYVLHGDEDFLKRQVLAALLPGLIGKSDPDLAVANYPGDKAEFSTVRNELDTVPFLSERRVVVIDQADPFVTRSRAALEKYVAAPSAGGVLVLDVKSWPANTKLAKAVPDAGTVQCKSPPAYKLAAWCAGWAESRYAKKLGKAAAELLVDLVGAQMGVLDQEIHKLADAVGDKAAIDARDVDELVGRSREADAFRIMDAVGNNRPAEALSILGELFAEGNEPLGVLAPLAHQLRQLARVARLSLQGVGLDEAMDRAGVPRWPEKRESVQRQLRHLGKARLLQLYDWLLEVDLGMKGGSQLPERTQLERLIVRLAKPRAG